MIASSKKTIGHWASGLVAAASLLPTPILLFVSSSVPLYAKNQSLLEYQPAVLLPFFKLSFLTMLAGVLIHLLYRGSPSPLARSTLWVYYLAGPTFMLFCFGRSLTDQWPLLSWLYATRAGLALWPVILLGASWILGLRLSRPVPVGSFALFGAALLVTEAHQLGSQLGSSKAPRDYGQLRAVTATNARRLPNIYHIVMDGYQAELFEKTLTGETKKALAGFVSYPKDTSYYHTSTMSLASVFCGKPFLYDRTRADYVDKAFNSRDSLLYWLKDQGYTTLAYLPSDWSSRLQFRLFDRLVFLENCAAGDLLEMNTEAFRDLWLFSNATGPLREWVTQSSRFSGLDEEDLDLLRKGRLFPSSMPVVSYLAMKRVLEDEGRLSPSNRYTLIHLLIPHAPYKLRADCSYPPGGQKTSALEQYRCASRLIQDFLEQLKRQGRFDESLIVIHGDHGGHFRIRHGGLRPARSRSLRAVLLIKPPGRSAKHPLEGSEEDITLLQLGARMKTYIEGARQSGALPQATPEVVGEKRETSS